mgnify:CR=1 FL=1
MIDSENNEVASGDIVKVLKIPEGLLLPDDEKPYIYGMLGNKYPIAEIVNNDRQVSLDIEIEVAAGQWFCGGLYLNSNEFILIKT